MSKYTLTYFPSTGRAQAARLMFAVAGIKFNDVQISFEDFPNMKNDESKFPLGQMPTLEFDGQVICQSTAIYRYLGNEFGFYGQTNLDKAGVDQLIETLADQFNGFVSIMFGGLKDEEKNAKYVELFSSAGCMKRMKYMSKILKRHDGGAKFFIGEKMCIADFIFYSQHILLAPQFPTYLDNYPELKGLAERIEAVDAVKKYMSENQYLVL